MSITMHQHLATLDHQHLWHPFTPMRQWREQDPIIIQSAQGFELIDTQDNRYIDGVSSLWCNVLGHQVPEIDDAIRQQLQQAAHTTLLGLSSPPAIELASRLAALTQQHLDPERSHPKPLNKVFFSDAGATAVEVAFKMAVGFWFHRGYPDKTRFIGLQGAYHGDTVGSMSVGFSELFHKPFLSLVFEVDTFPPIDPLRPSLGKPSRLSSTWPSEDEDRTQALMQHSLALLEDKLKQQADHTAAVVLEPVMQGAAGMIAQPPGFVAAVRELCNQHNVLLIADEVATGFGRTAEMFACAHDNITPDLLCLAKGLTGGYLPVAATLCTDEIAQAFEGELHDKRTLFHGHTYTGNALGCAAALATLDLFEQRQVIPHAQQSAKHLAERLNVLHDHPYILDIRQRGLMVGIELGQRQPDGTAAPFDFAKRTAYAVCAAMLPKGLWLRPLGDVLVLMPAPAMDRDTLDRMLDILLETLASFPFE